jgi:hypothetical protein
MSSLDIHLIFPPQWSPFQPFLSTPALKAYLENRGFTAEQSDWNVEFYDHFIGRSRLSGAIERLNGYVSDLGPEFDTYRNQALLSLGILSDYDTRIKLAKRLKSKDCMSTIEGFYSSVTAFKRLLFAFSTAEPVVEVGTSSLSTSDAMLSNESIDEFCDTENLNPFLPFFKDKVRSIKKAPRFFGLSVIGQEQILASLTLAKCLKAKFPDSPIIIGGSVFSRIAEKDEAIRHFFENYFDYVLRYEGEAPLEQLLRANDLTENPTDNLCFLREGRIIKTKLAPQLKLSEIPTPNFDDLNLAQYYSPDVVLPMLTTRGCYWDKCAFCYHGMIYGDRYRMMQPDAFAEAVQDLSNRYGVKHFALNDEAIPPKLFSGLPIHVEPQKYFFTGLYKFEKYFEPQHYQGMYDIGFRSLYIGLESANERVQRHMKKDNTQDVMISNLQDAHDAGIWNHTFNFFGFPTETREEAQETIDFLINHSDIIHSEGTGVFSFEHNAPISKDPANFGVKNVVEKSSNVLELYYDYEVTEGLSAEQAHGMVDEFTERKKKAGAYAYGGWIPREHLLVLLSKFDRDVLRSQLEVLDSGLDTRLGWTEDVNWFTLNMPNSVPRHFVVNTLAGKILETNRDAVVALEFMPKDITSSEVIAHFPVLEQVMTC